MFLPKLRRRVSVVILLVCLSAIGYAQSDPALLKFDRVYNSDEFSPRFVGGFKWLKGGNGYARIEPSPTIKGSVDLVSYDVATNKREVLLAAEKLVPAGAEKPLAISGYEWSADNKKMLIYTNTKKVWRLNTKGDYWVLDIATGKLTKLGGDAKPSTLMFAKFSPDGTKRRVCARKRPLCRRRGDGKITRLTSDGSQTMINGTADWVNEEEFNLRDCWRWSPDSKSIAFWQFDASGIKDFILLNNTADVYPTLTRIPYPKAGNDERRGADRCCGGAGGAITWMNTPGDLRNTYIAMMDWTDNSDEMILQHFNAPAEQDAVDRRERENRRRRRQSLTEKDDAWVDVDSRR